MNIKKKTLSFEKPCVLRLIPGLNDDNPIIYIFDDENDAIAFSETTDEMPDTGEGFNYLCINGLVDITYFDKVVIRNFPHDKLMEYIDQMYEEWILDNNYRNIDDETGRSLYGDAVMDFEYKVWIETELGVNSIDFYKLDIPFEEFFEEE